jgi:hypothetical protein
LKAWIISGQSAKIKAYHEVSSEFPKAYANCLPRCIGQGMFCIINMLTSFRENRRAFGENIAQKLDSAMMGLLKNKAQTAQTQRKFTRNLRGPATGI